jgi:hypothetical protein
MAVGEQHQVRISNTFKAVKTDDSQDINRAWKSIERILDFNEESLGYYKWKQMCFVCVCVCARACMCVLYCTIPY